MNKEKLYSKCAWRLIPFMMALYVVNYLDRVNVGFAALTMNADLGLSPRAYGFSAGFFFAGYILFQVPASVVLERIGARRAIFFMLTAWGAISACTALIQGPISFASLRFLLGTAEAGFFPVLMVYLSSWFPRSYRTRFTAMFMASIPLAYVVGSPISAFLLELQDVAGLAGWQWLFLLEGLPACVLGTVALFVLPQSPAEAAWLDAKEKQAIAAHIEREDVAQHREVLPALGDPRVWALSLVNFGLLFAAYGVQLWLPQIVQAIGFSTRATGFIAAMPFVVAVAAMILWGRSSDIRDERIWHVGLPALLAAACFLVASLAPTDTVSLVALSFASIFVLMMQPAFFGLLATYLSGPAAAGGIALVISLSNFGSLLGPGLVGVLREATGDYRASMAAFAMGLAVAAFIVLSLGKALGRRGTVEKAANAE
jgi:ACS family tartrate transporter-like MFS transporter